MLDVKALIDYLTAEGITAPNFGDTYLLGLEFSNDVRSGSGATWVNQDGVDLQVR